MPTYQKAQVAYAMLEFADDRLAPTNWADALRTSLRPGTHVERYNRRWYITRWEESANARWISGRLAYERATNDPNTVWDPETNDVREIPGMPVGWVTYVIDLETQRLAFQLRGEAVKPGAFQGNFQALLQKASNLSWRVRLEGVKQMPWEEWRATRVRRILQLWITVTPPNPRSDLPEIEELFESGVTGATLSARGEDVILERSELLREAFNHAQHHGKITAKAVTPQGDTEQWKSEEEAGVRKDAAQLDDTGHVPPDELRRLLERRAKADP